MVTAAEQEAPRRRTTVSELARTLAERRSAATAYVNIKVSAQGALQPDVNVTPDTTAEDAERMTTIALAQVVRIMAESNPATPRFPTKPVANRKPKEPAPSEDLPF